MCNAAALRRSTYWSEGTKQEIGGVDGAVFATFQSSRIDHLQLTSAVGGAAATGSPTIRISARAAARVSEKDS